MRKKIFLLVSILISALEMVGIMLANPILITVAKPLIVLSLICYYHYSTLKNSLPFVSALFFCWAGDVLLMFQSEGEVFLMLGLLCFLIGHGFFILSYIKARWDKTDEALMGTQKARFAFPIILAGSGLIVTLYPYLGDLKIPVMIYGLVITLMVLNASFRYGRTSVKSYWLVFAGAFFFMTSDTLLALHKFKEPFPHAEFYIMATYIAAQFLLVEGVIIHPIIKNKK